MHACVGGVIFVSPFVTRNGGKTHPTAQLGQPKPTVQYSHLEECAKGALLPKTSNTRISAKITRDDRRTYHGSLSRRDSPASFLFLPAFVSIEANDFWCSISSK